MSKINDYKAQQLGRKFIITKDGQLVEKGFNYLSEAQERADELNEGIKS